MKTSDYLGRLVTLRRVGKALADYESPKWADPRPACRYLEPSTEQVWELVVPVDPGYANFDPAAARELRTDDDNSFMVEPWIDCATDRQRHSLQLGRANLARIAKEDQERFDLTIRHFLPKAKLVCFSANLSSDLTEVRLNLPQMP